MVSNRFGWAWMVDFMAVLVRHRDPEKALLADNRCIDISITNDTLSLANRMKIKLLVINTGLLLFSAAFRVVAQTTLLTFDDVSTAGGQNPGYHPISMFGSPGTYDGLIWDAPLFTPLSYDVGIVNPVTFLGIPSVTAKAGVTGYGDANGLVSGPNVMDIGDRSTVSALPGTLFDFDSGYFTACWQNGVNVTLIGYRNGSMADYTYFTLSSLAPTFETLNWTDLDEMVFYISSTNPYICADNLTFDLNAQDVPEPSLLALFTFGSLASFWSFHRQKVGRLQILP
jgi:hypothetical protein